MTRASGGVGPMWTIVIAAATIGCAHNSAETAATAQGATPGTSAATAPQQRVLFLWGGADARGTPHLDPAFVLEAPPSPPEGEGRHRITGRDADGAELFSLRFEMPVIADGDGSSSFVFAVPVQEGWADRLASIILEGPGGSFTLDRETDRPMAILRDPTTGQIRQITRDLPPGRAGREAAEALAAETGFELFFSRGIPDSEDWRRSPSAKTRPLGFSAELGVCGAASGDAAGCCFPLVNFNYTFGR